MVGLSMRPATTSMPWSRQQSSAPRMRPTAFWYLFMSASAAGLKLSRPTNRKRQPERESRRTLRGSATTLKVMLEAQRTPSGASAAHSSRRRRMLPPMLLS